MKKRRPLIFFICLYGAIYLILWNFFPKFHGMITFFFIALLMDIYLWSSISRAISAQKPHFRYPITLLYWIPALLFVTLVIVGMFHPFLNWNIFLRTQLLSLVMITFIAKAIPIVFLLVADMLRVVRMLIRIHGHFQPFSLPPRLRALSFTGWISGGFLWLLLFLGITVWVFNFRVSTIHIPLQNLPVSFNGLRIVHLSDIHLGSWTCRSKLEEAVGITNSLKPDVILFTGDMFNYATSDGYGFEGILSKLSAKDGVFAILGNHDYGDYVRWPDERAKLENMKLLDEWYLNLGWRLLRNKSLVVKRGGDSIALIGVENWGAGQRFQKYADLDKALQGVSGVPVKILLSHDPSYWDSIVSKKYPEIGLTLSGHTHGGQFGIETSLISWSPVEWIYRHWGGLYDNLIQNTATKQYLYVNRGLGTVGYSGRVGMDPEISLIILDK